MNWSLSKLIIVILLLYLFIAGIAIFVVFTALKPETPEQFKEFWVRVGVVLVSTGVIVNITVSLTNHYKQINAAKDLEDKKETILRALEERKKELSEQIETLKGQIVRDNDLFKQTLNAKSVAYDKIYTASNLCYRELQKLASGNFDIKKVDENEAALAEAEALAANLDDEDIKIVKEIVQEVMNAKDEAINLKYQKPKLSELELKTKYEEIWKRYAPRIGNPIDKLTKRSPYYNKRLNIN